MNNNMDLCALRITSEYILGNFGITKKDLYFNSLNVPVVIQKSTILKNYKYTIATRLLEDILFEATYDGYKQEWYLEIYKKTETKCISMRDAMDMGE